MESQPHDVNLWQAFRNSDKKALGILAERHYRTLRHYGLKFLREETVVDDCIQELFLQLWQNRQQIHETGSVKHYLLKSLRNHIFQHLRLQKRFVPEELDWDSALPDYLNAEAMLIQEESLVNLMSLLQKQLANLPAREREALYLRYYENLSVPEIADVMNVNRQSVSNFLHKALSKLRDRLQMVAKFTSAIFFLKYFF